MLIINIMGLIAFSVDSSAENLELLKKDLENIEDISGSTRSPVVGQPFKLRPYEIYRNYLKAIEPLSIELVAIQNRINAQQNIVSLQQLGALVQRVSIENQALKKTFQYGETEFDSYKTLQTAIHNLEDAIQYWRLANHHRRFSRSNTRYRSDDDEVLQLKLKTALNSIDNLVQAKKDFKATTLELQKEH